MNSYADLLCTLAHSEQALCSGAELAHGRVKELAAVLGFEIAAIQDEQFFDPKASEETNLTGCETESRSEGVLFTATRKTVIWYVDRCEAVETETNTDKDNSLPQPRQPEAQPGAYLPAPCLRTPGQWQNLWDRIVIGHARGRRVDLQRCLRSLSQAKPLGRLPLLPHRHFNGPLVIIMDRPHRLRPAFNDMDAARASLVALVGKQGVSGYLLRQGPAGVWETLDDTLSIAVESDIKPRAQVVLIGAFGALESGDISVDWLAFMQRLQRRSHRVHLLPLCPLRNPPVSQTPLDTRQGRADAEGLSRNVANLLAALSQTWKTSSEQLRYLRHALPDADLHTELLVANHPYLSDPELHFDLHPDRLEKQLKSMKVFDADSDAHKCLTQAVKKWRGSRNARAQEMEQLQSNLLHSPAPEEFPRLLQLLEAVDVKSDTELVQLGVTARAYLPLLDLLAKQGCDARWQPLMQRARRIAIAFGEPLPGGYHADELSEPADARPRWLCQIGNHFEICSRPERALLQVGGYPYAESTGRMIGQILAPNPAGTVIIDRNWRYHLHSQLLPDWGERIWQDKAGRIYVTHAEQAVFVREPATPDQVRSSWCLVENPWPWADEVGVDEHGLWAEFSIGKARQRMRWIPPGTFMMGSPEEEEGRFDRESQHPVTLTHGYWLGETSCTQALWQAVMGQNPSHHKGDDLPVEQISWQDCHAFIAKLGKQLPGLNPLLPTEAQWEHACRAGSKTAYWWGGEMDNSYANNKGGGTEVEANCPANNFGLRSMSGNLYEWCVDWLEDYPNEPVIDPIGPMEGRRRVLRGGCWFYCGRSLRSAYRFAYSPDSRYDFIGLRLAGGYDPQVSKSGARPMSADRRERSDQRGSDQGAGGGPATGER